MPEVVIDFDKCIDCKICVQLCPMGVFRDEGEKVSVNKPDDCIICRGCEAACPIEAITVTG